MEENKKEKKSVVIEIVCFSVIILGIIGYFVYDLLISKKVDRSFNIFISELQLGVNEVKDIKDYIELENIGLNEIVFTSSDKNIAYIEDTNVVAPSKEGEAILTATYKEIIKTITIKVSKTNNTKVTSTDNLPTKEEPVLKKECLYNLEFVPVGKDIVNLKLNCENAKITMGNEIEANLTGTPFETGYKFDLQLKIAGRMISKELYKDKIVIQSDNLAANFQIFEFNQNYIILSTLGTQCETHSALVFDKSGNLITNFQDKDIVFIDDSIIKVYDFDSCMPDCINHKESDIRETITQYKYNGTILEKINEETKTYKDVCNN